METTTSVNKEIEPWDKEYDADDDDDTFNDENLKSICEKGSFQEDKLEEEQKSQPDTDDVDDIDKINNEKPISNVVMSFEDIIIWYCHVEINFNYNRVFFIF